MKRFWLAAALLALITGGCLLNARYADRLAAHLTGQLQQSCRLVQSGQWTRAASLTAHAARQWEHARFYRCVFLSRGDADQITLGFCRVQLLLQSRDREQYAPENAGLVLQLEMMGETEQLRWSSIL